MQHRRNMVAGFCATLTLSALLSACGSTSGTATATNSKAGGSASTTTAGSQATPTAKFHLKVGYVVGTEVELFYALKKNLFAQQGLNVTPVQFTSGPPMLAALSNGSIQAGIFGLPPDIGATSTKVPFKIWDLTDDAGNLNGLYVHPSSGITSVQGMEGKTIATAPGTTADIIMHIAMEKAGVPFSSVHVVNLPPPSLVDAYVRKSVQGVWIWNNWGARLLGDGAKLVANATQFGQEDPGIAVSTASVVKNNMPALAAYVRATDQAAKVINANPTAPSVISALSFYSGLSSSLAKQMMAKESDPVLTSKELLSTTYSLSLTSSRGFARLVTSDANMMLKLGLIKAVPNANSLFTTSVLKLADSGQAG